MSTKLRTRQAPSPTGYLHLGTARQILFTELFARSYQGEWYLRIEDTDRSRLVQSAVEQMLSTLKLLDLNPKEGVNIESKGTKNDFYNVWQTGDYGPYIQSERLSLYHEHANKLIEKGLAYWSYLTNTEKDELNEIKKITKAPINYLKANIERYGEESLFVDVETALADERKPALRYKIQREEIITCEDELLGKSEFDLNLEEDFNILKSDGYPTYHLAHLVDDYLMKTTLVIRAQEWYPSLARHITMFRDYWGEAPKYIHLPVILGEEGNKKLSKRDGEVNMLYYFDRGYLPEAIINYLAFLGWNPGTEKEFYLEPEDFISSNQPQRIEKLLNNISGDFSIEKLSKSPARFNKEKLNWFNKEFLKMMPLTVFDNLVKKYIQDLQTNYQGLVTKEDGSELNEGGLERKSILENIITKIQNNISFETLLEDSELTRLALFLDKTRITNFEELGADSSCVLNYQIPDDETLKWKKISTEESKANLTEIRDMIFKEIYPSTLGNAKIEKQSEVYRLASENQINNLGESLSELTNFWEKTIKDWLMLNQKDVGSYLWPLRVALSGKTKSPSPFELLAILKPEEALNRIQKSLKV
jgi:nondiscriminating glutamyl-tRNA synthetase